MIQALPRVTVSLVDNGDGTNGIKVNIDNTADLLLVMTMLAKAMVSTCACAGEAAATQAQDAEAPAPEEDQRLLILPDRRILRG
jgi:hypothetical protein